MLTELECSVNGTYPILKLYYFFGTNTTVFSVIAIFANIILLWHYQPSCSKRYHTLISGIGVADLVTGAAGIAQVVNMVTLAKCNGDGLVYHFITDNVTIFRGSQFANQVTISQTVYEISIVTSVGLTMFLLATWLLDGHLSGPTHSCVSGLLVVGYPTLWTTLNIHLHREPQTPAFKLLFLVLPVGVATLGIGILLFIKVKVKNSFYTSREIAQSSIQKIGILTFTTYMLFVVVKVLEAQQLDIQEQLHLTVYYLLTRFMPLFNAMKAIILLFEEDLFSRRLKNRIEHSWLRDCLCIEGVYLSD